ncbi:MULTISPECIES: DUF3099 domain-containing protein [unclassified Arthrobacter]|uniref:DUF3099 domain-containing protein n=1 Tax=unclassified Arthrobacter TaxID=235627 RepID=UPI000467A367|nr:MULTISPECIES: DUF3099 domain-containing protein [unclassified Arthrobacter]PVE19835.1 DUF3099 domain-containing protein [Arthrobacter sp. Bz4]
MSKQIRHGADVHSITDARSAHSDEIRGRMIKYSISMGIRLVCIVLVFFVEGWLQWVVIVGAVVLPYFAVIFANGGSDTSDLPHSQSLIDNVPLPALETAAPVSPEPTDDVLQGEIIDDDDVDPATTNDKLYRGRPTV